MTLVVFDCDGVLVDTERLAVGIEARALSELGWPHTPEEMVARFMGKTSEAMLAEVESVIGSEATRFFDERTTAEVHELFGRELIAVPGAVDVVETLTREGVSTCVASSGSHQKMRTTLGITGLFDLFDGRIFSASEVAHGKPAPDLFLHACAKMGGRPESTVVIEDSVYGVRAAVSAGMTVYGFAGGLSPAEALEEAGAVVFHEMTELFPLLGSRSKGAPR